MKKFVLVVFILSVTTSAFAQSQSHTWIDITASPYFASNSCTGTPPDAGNLINLAISSVSSGSGVIFFPAGCYLIQTQIVDTNNSAFLTYLGEGNVEFQAKATSPPTNSIIQFGNDTNTVTLRKIVNIKFNCNAQAIDGIDLDGLADSEFDSVSILDCRVADPMHPLNNWQMRTVGKNTAQWNNIFVGGLIDAKASNANGINLGSNLGSPYVNAWSFFGTKVLGPGSSPTGTGLDFEGSGSAFYGGVVSGWALGINLVVNNPAGVPRGGFQISGSYIENNTYAGVRVGTAGNLGGEADGVAITGNYFNCNNIGQYGVDLEQTIGFTVTGNHFHQCTSNAIKGLPDGTNQGADDGFVGANFIDGGQPVSLQGSGNTVTNSISTKSSAYTLNGADAWVNVTGGTTITIPHAMKGQRWDVFNSGSGTVNLLCDSGTINGVTSLSVGSQTGKSVTTDGTSCFAH